MPPIFKTLTRAVQGKPLFDPAQPQQVDQQQQAMNASPGAQFLDNDQLNLDQPLPGQQVPQQVRLTPQSQPQPPTPQLIIQNNTPTINVSNSGTYPVVRIRRTTTRVFNGQMEVRSRIMNDSPYEVDVHKADMLGTIIDIRCPLNPGQDREFLLYRGPCMQDNSHHQMSLEYKAENGAYFASVHDIKYLFNADHSFTISELDLHLPIRHIAG